jgi:type II secretory pathway pseudopilin PulG
MRRVSCFRKTDGVIDLASVMVGILVMSIVASIATVSVVGVLRFSENENAKGAVHIARTSELSARIAAREFLPTAELVAAGYSVSSPSLVIETNANRTCYVAVAASATGVVYFGTSQNKTVAELADELDPGCVGPDAVKTMAHTACMAAANSAAVCVKWA